MVTQKVFISYSHRDEDHKEELDKHLSLLKREGHITTWNDRRIPPGGKWGDCIDENLSNANIIIALISSDFIASDYCTDIEVEKALNMFNNGDAIVIPIIARPCDWESSLLGNLQALPKDAKAITSWNNPDEAWVDVAKGIRKVIAEIGEKVEVDIIINQDSLLQNDFLCWLQDTEVELHHRHTSDVTLDDIFVYQDLRQIDNDLNKSVSTLESSAPIIRSGYNLLYGDEQSGKTSLAKKYFIDSLNNDLYPIFISGENINKSDVDKVLSKALSQQYTDLSCEDFLKIPNKILIIDDYAKTTLNTKYQNIFIDKLKSEFNNIIVFANEPFKYVAPDISSFDIFKQYEILLFGNVKRSELIQKWIEIGNREELDEKELYLNLDILKQHVDSFVRNNVVPSKPIYLLTILQTFESYSPLGVELTSYGHCYQFLIYQALEKANIRQQEVDSYLNCLTELAGTMFLKKSKNLGHGDLRLFLDGYYEHFIIGIAQDELLEKLLLSKILIYNNEAFTFKYRYIYYFYAAKYLSENLSKSDSSKHQIHDLLSNLHREDCANIIIFITHHTKDPWIIEEIQYCMMELFDDEDEATLNKNDLSFMEEFLEKIPKLVIEQREIESERKRININKDHAEAISCEIDRHIDNLESTDLLAKLNRAFKAIELSGQILRNRHGSLSKDTIINLLEDSYGVGLRFLQYFLHLSDTVKDDVVQIIQHIMIENPTLDDIRVEKKAKNVFLIMTYGVIFSILRKIAFSLGAKELGSIYMELGEKIGSPAVTLLNQSIELQFMKKVDIDKLKSILRSFDKNPVCIRILKEIVIQHIYMHHVGYKEKQQIANILQIPILNQIVFEKNSSMKQ